MNEAAFINVPDLIDQQKVSGYQIRVLALCAAVVFMDGFDAQAIGYVAPSISKLWSLPPGALKDVFAAGLIGLMLGALIFGPVADRVGRKGVIIFCTLAFGVCTLLTVTAGSVKSLLFWRFVTGFGLGGAMPNAIALTSEYSPHRSRATMVMVMFCGFSLGSALGGIFAAQLISRFGWTGIFWLGGLLPLALVPVLIFALPESIRLLALKGTETARVRKILLSINPELNFGREAHFTAHEEHLSGFSVRHLFREARAVGTVLLWIMFFMNLLNLYFLANWLPTVINNAGLSVELAMIVTSLLQFGGMVGVLFLGWLIDRFSPFRVLAAAYLVAGFFIGCIGFSASTIWFLIPAVFGAGFCIVGAQIGVNAMAAAYYPTSIRSTGVGWALGIGRIGSIIGPWVGGFIMSLQWQTSSLFLTAVGPALCAALAAFMMASMYRPTAVASAATAGLQQGLKESKSTGG